MGTATDPVAGPLARAAEFELRLGDARRAVATASERAAGAERERDAALAALADRDERLAQLREGLVALRGELGALRALLRADDADAPARSGVAGDPARLGELARGARELLASGRLDAADEVIRGLEDAAARLRASTPEEGPGPTAGTPRDADG